MNNWKLLAATTGLLLLLLSACSQKDPAAEAIEAAENALNAVYEDAEKYVPERYAEVKAEVVAARTAFNEERYADAISAVRDVPAHAEALAKLLDGAAWHRLGRWRTTRRSGEIPGG